jgi:hypothetical protein
MIEFLNISYVDLFAFIDCLQADMCRRTYVAAPLVYGYTCSAGHSGRAV